MTNDSMNRRNNGFPIIPALILFGMIALTLLLLLPEASTIRSTQSSVPQPTAIAAAATEAAEAAATEAVVVEEATVEAPTTDEAAAATEAVTDDEAAATEETSEEAATEAAAAEEASEEAAVTEAAAEDEAAAAEETSESVEVAAVPELDPAMVAAGQNTFIGTCSACHGMDARGVQNLGKDLVHSEFVNSLSDEELVQFIATGRPIFDPANTTGIDMPARGGNPTITDQQLLEVVQYLRSLAIAEGITPGAAQPAQAEASDATTEEAATEETAAVEPTAAPEVEAQPTEVAQAEQATEVPAAAESGETVAVAEAEPVSSERLYNWSCARCHGLDGQGEEPFGPSLEGSELLQPENEEEFFAFLTAVNPFQDPAIKFPHPTRGGYPQLTDEQVTQVIEYTQTLLGQE